MSVYVDDLKNTIRNTYPNYLKKDLLKQAKSKNVVSDSKQANQLLLLTDTIDVSNCSTLNEKIDRILNNVRGLKYIEEYEYTRQYRHFCYFTSTSITIETIRTLIESGSLKQFDKAKTNELIDNYAVPSIYITDELLYLKISFLLAGESDQNIKFSVICVFDTLKNILELRFDRVGIAYKNSYDFYKIKISQVLDLLTDKLGITLECIDFKAVLDYARTSPRDSITIYAQRMERNGMTAYLEAYDTGECVMPILGELENFIQENQTLFEENDKTREIREKLNEFKTSIEIKSDMPMVKVRLEDKSMRIGIQHNYKGKEYSLFMNYEDLLGDEEKMSYARDYFIGLHKELGGQV